MDLDDNDNLAAVVFSPATKIGKCYSRTDKLCPRAKDLLMISAWKQVINR